MDEISSVASASSALSQARLNAEVAIRTIKMANDQQAAVLELLLKTMASAATSLGQYLDVTA